MVFHQSTAPIGWTKVTDGAYDNAALRVTTGAVGSGGATGFTSVFGTGKVTGGTTLTTSQMPAHGHTQRKMTSASGSAISSGTAFSGESNDSTSTGNTGGGNAHDHTLSLNLLYRDVIIATKD